MDQSIRVDNEEGKLLFEFSLWAMKEFWKGVGRKAEDFPIPKDEKEALQLCIDSRLLVAEDLEEFNPKAKLFIPDEEPMPEGLELFQRDANGNYVREPRSEGNYIENYVPPKEVSEEEEEICDCGCGHSSNKCPYWLAFYLGKDWEERDD